MLINKIKKAMLITIAAFSLSGIIDCAAHADFKICMCVKADTNTIKTYEQLVNAAKAGGTYEIADSISLEKKVTIPKGKKLTLVGNEKYTIKTKKDLSIMFDVEGTLVLDNTVQIKGGVDNDYNVTMAIIKVSSGTLTINDAVIYKAAGHAIHVVDGGKCTLNGGRIVDNKGIYNSLGGAVRVTRNSKFTMTGGSITKNTSGGVYVGQGSSFTMSGGTIANNTVGAGNIDEKETQQVGYGGGIYTNGTVSMTGGTIKNNTATKNGGGICIGTSGKVILKKDACVLGTSNNPESNDIYFRKQKQLYIESVLAKKVLIKPDIYENGLVVAASESLTAEQYQNSINLSKSGWYIKPSGKNAILSQRFKVVYKDPNGVLPEANKESYYNDSEVTPEWKKTGYILKGWSASVNGKIIYGVNQTFKVTENLTLYAVWEEKTIKLTYDAKGGENTPEETTYLFSKGFTVANQEPTKIGYNFAGWYLTEDYTGTCYVKESNVVLSTDTDVVLYAKWEPKTITLKYNANGGYNAPGAIQKLFTDSFVVSDLEPKRVGYSFVGWKDERGIAYKAGDTIIPQEQNYDNDLILYAVWEEKTIKLTYDLNGGEGTIANQTLLYADSVSKGFEITNEIPKRTGFTFTGWFLNKDCTSTTVYAAGGNIKLGVEEENDLTLYAGWVKSVSVVEDNKPSTNTNQTSNFKISKTSVKLGIKESLKLKVNNAEGSIVYLSSNPNVAIIGNDGTIVALKKGTTTVSVTNNGKTKKCVVKVYAAPKKITAKYNKKTMQKGKKLKLSYTLTKGSYGKVTFDSSNKKIVTVDSKGIVTAKKKGKAKVRIKAYNGKKAIITITVK